MIDGNSDVIFKGYVVANLGQTPKSHKYKIVSEVLKTDSVVTMTEKLSGILYLKKNNISEGLKPGDVILVKGRLVPFEKPLNPFAFDYSRYLKHERTSFRIWASPELVKLENGRSEKTLPVSINRLHDKISDVYERSGITGSELALLKALFMGDRSELVQENKKAFSDAGVMHLLAVSGLHLGIIYMLLIFLLKPLKNDRSKKIKVCLVLMVIWGYALFTGFSSSVFRAAVMFSMVEVGTLLKRSNSVYNQLIASMLIIILVEPYSIYKAGFWLSHAAVAGIVTFYPLINNLLTFRFIIFRWIWSLTSVSVAAQLATFPLSIYYFHKFPVYFILSNVLMVPVLAPVLLLAFVIALFAVLPVGISFIKIFSGPLNVFLGYMTDIAGFTGNLPGAVIRYITFSGVVVALTGMLFLSIIIYFNEDRRLALFTFMISLLLLVSSLTYDKIREYKYSAFVVFTQNYTGIFNMLDQKSNKVYITDSLSDIRLDYVAGGYWSKHGARFPEVMVFPEDQPEIRYFSVGDKKILLLHNIYKLTATTFRPDIDYLVLSGRRCPGLNELNSSVGFDNVILSSGLDRKSRYRIRKSSDRLNIPCYDVCSDGAWLCETY